MTATCPHCSAQIEIDAATLAALQGQPHFACPACNNPVPVPPPPGPRAVAPVRVHGVGPQIQHPHSSATLAKTHRGLNRNLLILGSAALLVLGGIGFFLATRGGSIFNSEQKITNEIINNSYFTQLVASGATTEKDLEAIAVIRPYGDGYIGVSKESFSWAQAQDLAKRTRSEVLAVEESGTSSNKPLLAWLADSFRSHLSSSVWVQEMGLARVLDGTDVLASTALGHPRKTLLCWHTNASPHAFRVANAGPIPLGGTQPGMSCPSEVWARNDWEVLLNENQAKPSANNHAHGWFEGEIGPEYNNRPYFEGKGKRTGILILHPLSQGEPAKIAFRKTVSASKPVMVVAAAGSVHGDFVLRCVVNGEAIKEYVLDGKSWENCVFDLSRFAGKTTELELWNVPGGAMPWYFETCYVDKIEFVIPPGSSGESTEK